MSTTIETTNISANFPRGIILAWYAKMGSFPIGWGVCDGTNGTPDLRRKFIRGASDMADVGGCGGAENHSHKFTTSSSKVENSDGWNAEDMNRTRAPMTTGFDHSHSISGTTNIVEPNSLPPYVDVLYIMKL